MDERELRREIAKCNRCGQCRAVCPSFLDSISEGDVARGRVMMVKGLLEGWLEANPEVDEALSRCLACRSCFRECPGGVPVDRIVVAGRLLLTRKRGLSAGKRVVTRGLLLRPSLVERLLGLAGMVQRLAFERLPADSGLRLRLPLPGMAAGRIVPPLAPRPFRQTLSSWLRVDNPVARVLYFTGCTTNYLYPEIGQAAVDTLRARGVEVIIPPGQRCCGIPALLAGDEETARALARANLEEFGRYRADALVVNCPTCLMAWKEEYLSLAGGGAATARELAAKACDYSQVAELIEWKTPAGWKAPIEGRVKGPAGGIAPQAGAPGRSDAPIRVAYHDPCHHLALGIKDSPRYLLGLVPGAELVEMPGPARCCGFAGSFSLRHYDLASRIGDRRVEQVKAAGPDLVVTSCPGCVLHLRDTIYRHRLPYRVMHLAQLVAGEPFRTGARAAGS